MFFDYPTDKVELLAAAQARMVKILTLNKVPVMLTSKESPEYWQFEPCAYYRANTCYICLDKCASPAGAAVCRNWNWPGNTVDRTPYGVYMHEAGHHFDLHIGLSKGLPTHAYSSDFSSIVREESGEDPISSYCPNDAEWFAEMFRVFVSNAPLLKLLRPRTYKALAGSIKLNKFTVSGEIEGSNWGMWVGKNAPARIVKSIHNKVRLRDN